MPTIEFGKFSPYGEGNSANVKNISIDGCLCCRPKLHVLCKSCGWICRGRIRYRCPQHPNVCIFFVILFSDINYELFS